MQPEALAVMMYVTVAVFALLLVSTCWGIESTPLPILPFTPDGAVEFQLKEVLETPELINTV